MKILHLQITGLLPFIALILSLAVFKNQLGLLINHHRTHMELQHLKNGKDGKLVLQLGLHHMIHGILTPHHHGTHPQLHHSSQAHTHGLTAEPDLIDLIGQCTLTEKFRYDLSVTLKG